MLQGELSPALICENRTMAAPSLNMPAQLHPLWM